MAEPKDTRKRDAAIGVAGAGTLAGTASLQRLEGRIKDHRQGRYDKKINSLKSQMPTKGTPVANRKMVNGQYVANSKRNKTAKKNRTKRLTGEINSLQAKKNAIRRPQLAGNTKATWTGIAVGAPMLWHGTRSQFEKSDSKWKRRDADAAILGAGLGAGAYQEASYALKPLDRRAERKIADDPKLKQRQNEYQKANRPKGIKVGDRAWRPYFRNYPKDLPGGKLKRTIAVTHTGKTGGALTVAAGAAGAAGAASISRKHREKKVSKSMTESAFGVDHGVISKAEKKQPPPSLGREAAGTAFGWAHGAVAGKKGKKLKAAGTGLGGAVGGGTAGAVGGALLTRGRSPDAIRYGNMGGSLAGANWAVKRNQRKGYLKPEKK